MKQEEKAKKVFELFCELVKPLLTRLTYENSKKYKRLINSKFDKLNLEDKEPFLKLAKEL